MAVRCQGFRTRTVKDSRWPALAGSLIVGRITQEPEARRGRQSGQLKKLKGAEFDRAFVDHEVTYRQAVIDALVKTLVPNAKNEELKALLIKVRPAFVAHLEHAKSMAGARGYLLKDSAGAEVVEAVRAVHSGRRYLGNRTAASVIDDYVAEPASEEPFG